MWVSWDTDWNWPLPSSKAARGCCLLVKERAGHICKQLITSVLWTSSTCQSIYRSEKALLDPTVELRPSHEFIKLRSQAAPQALNLITGETDLPSFISRLLYESRKWCKTTKHLPCHSMWYANVEFSCSDWWQAFSGLYLCSCTAIK